MIRLAAATVLTLLAGVVGLLTHHHHKHRPASALVEQPPVSRASRDDVRVPLRGRHGSLARRAPVRRTTPRNGTSLGITDITMYCATGSRNAAGRWPRLGDVAVIDRSLKFGTRLLIAGRTYLVEDWIGSGSQFDIFGGDDEGCEARALAFGRRHLEVVIEP